jgi:hypothetical protein
VEWHRFPEGEHPQVCLPGRQPPRLTLTHHFVVAMPPRNRVSGLEYVQGLLVKGRRNFNITLPTAKLLVPRDSRRQDTDCYARKEGRLLERYLLGRCGSTPLPRALIRL